MKRALISVFDKTNVVEFAKELTEMGWEIISTGGTSAKFKAEGIPVMDVSDLTKFPECFDGRLKTIHPHVEGGILAIRDNEIHQKQMVELGIDPIDIVVCNLYPFKQTVLNPDSTHEDIVENIDIGGPTMLRAAAKNYNFVSVITDPEDYSKVIEELKESGETSKETKEYLAAKVFEHTAHYDALISGYFNKKLNVKSPKTLTLTYEKKQDLRYGENPHQNAAFYTQIQETEGTLTAANKIHGKELSYNNIGDTDGALETLKEFEEPTIVAAKHANPCGIGSAETIAEAFQKAYDADPVSIFGGIVAANREIDKATAEIMSGIFLEVIVAPSFSKEALEVLTKKKNLRLLELPEILKSDYTAMKGRTVLGGLLIQDQDHKLIGEELKVVTKRQPSEKEMEDLMFAWKTVKHAKSNGIALAKDKTTTGVGPGQVSRIWALENAIRQGAERIHGSVMASDAFFPFSDCVEAAHKAGVTAIIQPGGSIRDEDSIKAADEFGIAMVFTGMRHFKH
ncbi:bifunctional phosphoribosylaminoimidazolecarboxamide formyltransferase/IMP cyclohydrolase [Marinifilum sp. D714]|uniref:bifunctional phosphoribosylaminoimidazolecarboxamide formyltransferase/IMP cyclohydrolase n=1 Tax=Marinifilum sp. D714 TaxID=2937523 RepID=UPI0027CC76B0|nr:bifunctional phosphoribosylaminoimidazolecarboxamide formyltransferase/IMP cyclohydrolase [Marinifilum sp. D714]MDQ2179867.1 bifunctional phosphoribosylaminoimidazolecarboxamide formyltransferase/IMP cyclohydrolase [Marinifilum sp. D714]